MCGVTKDKLTADAKQATSPSHLGSKAERTAANSAIGSHVVALIDNAPVQAHTQHLRQRMNVLHYTTSAIEKHTPYSHQASRVYGIAYLTREVEPILVKESECFNDWEGRGYDDFVPAEVTKITHSGG